MKKSVLLTVLLSLMCAPSLWAIDTKPLSSIDKLQYPVILRIYFDETSQLQTLSDNSDVWTINPSQKFAVVYVTDSTSMQAINQLGMPMRPDLQLMKQYEADLRQINQAKQGGGIPGFSCYGTVAETFQRMDQMVLDHPDLAEIVDIGDSWEKIQNGAQGDDLKIIKITNQNTNGDKPVLFMASSIHAREYTTAELNTRFAEYLLDNYGTDADVTWIIDNHEIHLSLITNPDGRHRAQTGILWRKNANNNFCANSNDRGVDLNRNYPYEWGIGGSTSACSEVFIGPSSGSEPEIMAQMDYLRTIFDDNRGPGANDPAPADTPGIFVDIHSFSQLVLWPWGYTNNNTPNDNQLQALGKRTAFFNNYRPQPVNDLVLTGGGSIDATYGELGMASLAFELGTAFFQDCATFEDRIFPDNLQALLYLARVTQAPYTQSLGPDVEDLLVIPNVITSDTSIQVTGVADDDRYNQTNGAQSTDSIQSVTAYINELPIHAVSGQSLSPVDGAFNESREAFSGLINTNGLAPGKNLLYVQASDNAQGGGTFAQFIDVVEPQDVAQLSGTVRNALTGETIENALLTINQSQALSSANGSYVQFVQPGTADLLVSADEFADFTLSGLNLAANTQTTQDISLQPFCDLLNDDVESGNTGWQAESPWAISTDQSTSPTHAWTDSPGGEYSNNINISLTSPVIEISDADAVEVSYMSLCDTEATFDFGYLEAQFDNGTWQEINRCDNQPNWQQATHQLALPGGTQNLRIRFRLESDGFVTQDGWHVDDIAIKASGAACGDVLDDVIFEDDFE